MNFKKIIILLCVSILLICFLAFPVSAASAVYDVSTVSKIVVGSTNVGYTTSYSADFYPAPNAVWYYVSGYTDFEMHFSLPITVNSGDVVTISSDIYTMAYGWNHNSSIVFAGCANIYSWHSDTISVNGESFIRWQETYTFTATSAATEIVLIPRGLTNPYVAVNKLTVSVADKDYSAEINNSTNDIKNNADKNANEIKENQDKNTDKTINESYGYESPDDSDTTAGIEAGESLIDSLNDSIDEFNASLGDSVDNLMTGIQPFKKVVHGFFDIFPVPVQILFSFTMVFIVLRKVVGR